MSLVYVSWFSIHWQIKTSPPTNASWVELSKGPRGPKPAVLDFGCTKLLKLNEETSQPHFGQIYVLIIPNTRSREV